MSKGYTTYEYFADFAFVLCEGPVTSVRRIWFDEELVYDMTVGNEGWVKMKGLHLTIYLGTDSQLPDPLIEAAEGVGNVPGYRGICYCVVRQLPLKKFGGRRPNIRAEVTKEPAAKYEVNLGDQGTTGTWHYSTSDNTLVNGHGSRWDTNTNTLLSQVSPNLTGATAGGGNVLDQETGTMYTWEWLNPAPHDYMTVVHFDPRTGQQTISCDEAGTKCDVIVDGCKNVFADGNNMFRWPTYGTVVLPAVGNEGVHIWGDRHCPPFEDSADFNLYDVSWCVEDSNTNLWYTIPSTNEIVLHPGDRRFNVNTLFGDTSPGRMMWVHHLDSMLVQCGTDTHRLSYNGTTLVQEAFTDGGSWGSLSYSDSKRWHYEDTVWMDATVTAFQELDVRTLEYIRTVDVDLAGPGDQNHGGFVYDVLSHAIWTYTLPVVGRTGFKILLDRVPTGGQPLDVVVSSLSEGVLDPEYKNTSGLSTDFVRGFAITRQEPIRDSIRRLMISHRFGSVDSGRSVVYKFLDIPSVMTIPEDDLSAHMHGAQFPEPLSTTIMNDSDFPKTLEVTGISEAREYESITFGANRPHATGKGVEKIALSEVLTNNEIRRTADIGLNVLWKERFIYEKQVGRKYADLEPLDVVTVTYEGNDYEMRINEQDIGKGIFSMKAISTDVALFSSVVSTVDTNSSYVSSIIETPGATYFYFMDLPLLDNADDHPGFYSGFQSDNPNWLGATLFRSDDPDGSNTAELIAGATESEVGILVSSPERTVASVVTSSIKTTVWDWDNTFTLRMFDGAILATDTEDNVLNGANAFAVIPGGEIIQFVDATAVASSTYRVSQLLRGRRGTEHALASSVQGRSVVMLAAGATQNVPTNITTHGVEYVYRAVTIGDTLFDSQWAAYTNNNTRLKPFSGVCPSVSFDGNKVDVEWYRRTRLFIEPEYKVVPLGEATESYEVDIRATDSTTVLRTIATTASQFAYTLAQMTTDFGGYVTSFDVDVYQMSDSIGRGYPLTFATADTGIFLPLYTDFSEYTVDEMPSDWSEQTAGLPQYVFWRRKEHASCVASACMHCFLDLNVTGLTTWDSAGVFADMEMLFSQHDLNLDGNANNGGGLRMQLSGGGPTGNGYFCSIDSSGDGRIWNGAAQLGTTVTLGLSNVTRTWTRFRIQGNVISAKWWQGSLGAEPVSWSIEHTNNTWTTGAVGLRNSRAGILGAAHTYYDQIAVAYDGDTAEFI